MTTFAYRRFFLVKRRIYQPQNGKRFGVRGFLLQNSVYANACAGERRLRGSFIAAKMRENSFKERARIRKPVISFVPSELSPLRASRAAADKGDGKRYIVHSDELLSAFLELELTLL